MSDLKQLMKFGVRKYIKQLNSDNQVITTTIYNSIYEGNNPLKTINRQINTIEQRAQLALVFNESEILSLIKTDPTFIHSINQYDKWNNLNHSKKVKLIIFFKEVDKEVRCVLSAIVQKAFNSKEIANLFTLEQVIRIFNHEVSTLS